MDLDAQRRLIDRLGKGSWFGRLPLALRELVVARSRVRTYDKGQVLSAEGSPPKGLFAVLEGQVHLVTAVGTDDEALVYVGEPGFWFGEFGLLAGAPTVVTALAHTTVRALVLPKVQFDLIVDEEPRYYRHFASLIFERYAILLRAFADFQELTPDVRLRRRLAVLAHLQRLDRAATGPVTLAVTQAELSRMIGVSRQTLNAMLGRLQQQGLIELGFRKISVLDPGRLGEIPEVAEVELRPTTTRSRSSRLEPAAESHRSKH